MASAGCILWLQVLQPVFAVVALGALAQQVRLVWGRPRRTKKVLAILWTSVAVTALMFAAWGVAWLRYR